MRCSHAARVILPVTVPLTALVGRRLVKRKYIELSNGLHDLFSEGHRRNGDHSPTALSPTMEKIGGVSMWRSLQSGGVYSVQSTGDFLCANRLRTTNTEK